MVRKNNSCHFQCESQTVDFAVNQFLGSLKGVTFSVVSVHLQGDNVIRDGADPLFRVLCNGIRLKCQDAFVWIHSYQS